MKVLRTPGPRIEKLVFALAKKKLAVLSTDPLFRGAWRSLPLQTDADRTITEHFQASSADVFRQLHAVLLRQRCCVSSPIVVDPIIVPIKESSDVRIGFNCIDNVEDNRSTLTLIVHEDTDNFAQQVVAHMVSCMTA
jgi:hypothetical protein